MKIKTNLFVAIFVASLFFSSTPLLASTPLLVSADTGLPNLSISSTDLSISPTTIKEGINATFKAKVRNTGTASATSVKVGFFIGKTLIGEKTISSISANNYSNTSFVYKIPSDMIGEQEYRFVIDSLNTISESDESDNEALIPFTVSANLPDLSVSSADMTFTPATLTAGTKATFKVYVHNIGVNSAQNVNVQFFIGENPIGETSISSISAKGKYLKQVTYTLPSDFSAKSSYSVVVDRENLIKELSESNNSAEIKLDGSASTNTGSTGTASLSDLSVVKSDLSYTGKALTGGSKTTLKAKITNLGPDKASNVYVRFFANGQQIYEKKLTSLSKNGKATVTYPYTIPANSGSFTFSATADPDNTIPETDEKNNTAQIEVPVTKATNNLIITSFKPSKTNPTPGQTISWKIIVKNAGTAKITNAKIALYTNMQSSEPTNVITVPSLNPGVTTTKSISWKVPLNLDPPINYLVRASVDPDNAIEESNELDNIATYSLSLTVPDLSIALGEYMGLSGLWTTGTFSQFRVKVKNNNIANLTNVKLGLYYALGSISATRVKVAEVTISPLQKNKTFENMFDRVFMPAQAAIGSKVYFFAVVDPEKNIPEFDETNNELVFDYTVVQKKPQAVCPCLYVTVYDENSAPLAATVKYENTATGEIRTKTVGSDPLTSNAPGFVVFDSLPSTAPVKITVSKTGYRTQTDSFTYQSYNDQTTYRTYDMDKKAVVQGTVKNQAGQPMQWVTVKVEGTSLEDVTDANGNYGFLLNGGTYTLRFLKTGYARIIESNLQVNPLSNIVLNKTMTATTAAYTSGMITNDEGQGLSNVDIYINNTIVAMTAPDGHFTFNNMSAGTKTFKFKKPGYIDTEFTEIIEAGNEYNLTFTMFKPSTDTHVERGTQLISWHQHVGTPANAFFIPEYNVDVWWGLGRVKMAMDFTQNGNGAKLTKLVINNHGDSWECNKVEGSGDIETSAIDIPITISAGGCSPKLTQMDVYKVAIESDGAEVWSNNTFWTNALDPMNTGTKVFTLNNLNVNWNNDLKVKMWVRVQKKAVVGTDGDGSGALSGYHLDKKLITWYPQKPPTTVISTSWSQVGGYFLGILDNPVNAVTGFTDIYSVEEFNQYTMEEVLPQNFPN